MTALVRVPFHGDEIECLRDINAFEKAAAAMSAARA